MTPLYYDQPEYDIFWQTLSDLNVPLYLHPRTDVPEILNFQYSHAKFLIGPAQQFSATLSGHVLGCVFLGNRTIFSLINTMMLFQDMRQRRLRVSEYSQNISEGALINEISVASQMQSSL